MDTKSRLTKQGLRDLNFYGSRKKVAEVGAEGALAVAAAEEPGAVEPQVEVAPAAVATAAAATSN